MRKMRILNTIVTVMWIILGVANIVAWSLDYPVQPSLLNGILFIAIGAIECLNLWCEKHQEKD